MIRFAFPTLCIALAGLAQQALGQESNHPGLDDRFTFKLGYLSNEAEGELTYNRPPLPETPVKLDDLGINGSTDSGWAAFRWRFKEKWSINFLYNRFEREGHAVVGDPFNYDQSEFPVGTVIESEARADAYIFNLGYSFIKKPNYEIGAGLGLHAFDLKVNLDAQARLGDMVSDRIPVANEEMIAPVPNLRLFGLYAFNEKVLLKLDGGWLSLEYEDFGGRYFYGSAGVEYRFTERFGLGAAYQYTDMELDYDPGNKKVEYEMTFDGLSVFASYSF